MEEGLESKFSQKDIDDVSVWVYRANELMHGRHEFNPEWARQILEGLEKYKSKGNTVQMCYDSITRMYKEKVGVDSKAFVDRYPDEVNVTY